MLSRLRGNVISRGSHHCVVSVVLGSCTSYVIFVCSRSESLGSTLFGLRKIVS
ncbi:MAG: hypothetical protein IIZ26_01810 [Oscillospiraceae bacterium]|nr:hypothetical protein [Oscillospiraceae bacterium]